MRTQSVLQTTHPHGADPLRDSTESRTSRVSCPSMRVVLVGRAEARWLR